MINFFKYFFNFRNGISSNEILVEPAMNNVKSLLCGTGTSEINATEIVISEYPFEPSVAYPNKVIFAKDIDSFSLDFGVCKIYIENDIVFVSAEKKKAMRQFAEANEIKLTTQSMNWDWILEPFLDTEFTNENEKLVLARLIENGFESVEVDTIRHEVKKQMLTYNFDTMLWDWSSLSLIDVLSAMRAKYNKEDFSDFYTRALAIEKRKR